MAGEEFLLSGNQIATYTTWSATYPPPDYDVSINLDSLVTLGSETDRFFLARTQGTDPTTVTNGDLYVVYPAVDDGTGTLVPDTTTPVTGVGGATPDAYDHTGAGDNYAIFGLYYGEQFAIKLDGFDDTVKDISFVEGTSNGELDFSEIIAASPDNVICFALGTRIATPLDEIPVEDLRVGDLVSTYDGSSKRIRWIGSRKVRLAAGRSRENLRPVRILAGALGQGFPSRDILVSRQHRMLVSSKIAARMFAASDVLIPAIKLTELPGVFVDNDVEEITYFHFLFDKHEIVFAEGAPAESLFIGPEALEGISPDARKEIFEIFPDLQKRLAVGEKAHLVPSGRRQKKLIARHLKNRKPILESFRSL